jgi:F420-non-reducing hydrogenase large subunit
VTGPDSGIYRVGPLGRINVCSGYTTPLAQKEYEFLAKTVTDLGVKGPVNHTLAYHWARVIELQYAAERMLQLASDKSITSDDVRGPFGQPKEGVGICEAPRGTLIHHYASDKDGLCTKINMIVATTNNYAAINTSVIQAAKALIKNGEVSPGLLNKVEMAFRCYDPCNSCGTHALNGGPALEITVKRRDGSVLTAQKNF